MAVNDSNVTFRPATLQDYEGVLAISGPDHYEGYDYLADWYDLLVKSPSRRCFVVLCELQNSKSIIPTFLVD